MKLEKLIFLFTIIGSGLSFAGCTQFLESELTPLSFNTAIPYASRTPAAEHTPTEPLATDSPTQIPAQIPPAIPTLASEKAQERLLELLANNGTCDLPCLWGIVPGKSDSLEARVVLEPLSQISQSSFFDSESGHIEFSDIDGDLEFYTNVSYQTENQILTRVSISASLFKKKIDPTNGEYWVGEYESNSFLQRFKPYTLSEVLSKLGTPASVEISTDGGPARGRNVPGFYVLLLYPDQGVLVRYTTSRQLVGETVQGCLANAHAEFELFPSGQGASFSDYLSRTIWQNFWPIPVDNSTWKPIEKASSLSLQQFYEMFRQPTNTCLETPKNIWHVPEQ